MERLSLERMRTGFTVRVEGSWWFWPIKADPLIARTLEEIPSLLARVEANPKWSAIALTYEAAPAFDPAFVVQSDPSRTWLAIAYLFDTEPEVFTRLEPAPLRARVPIFEPSISRDAYDQMFESVRSKLASGDSYQVNATFPLTVPPPPLEGRGCERSELGWGPSAADLSPNATQPPRAADASCRRNVGPESPNTPQPLRAADASCRGYPSPESFALLCGDTPPPFAAYFPAPDDAVASLSPELFFELRGTQIHSRPMKGTRPRHADPQEMVANEKDRAENLMIVDMIRNDLGRIAKTGSVHVPKLFELEDHGTVWQMTSTVAAETDATLTEALAALFPCASVVGAPKVETTKIIAEIESVPRGLYTGAIGIVKPGFARFSVAIRTLEQDTYGIGSGLVWDSNADEEWAECLAKAEILRPYGEKLCLLETIRWEPEAGFYFLDEHLDRMGNSARALGIPIEIATVTAKLQDAAAWIQPMRVRVLASLNQIETQATPIDSAFNNKPSDHSISATLSHFSIDSQNPWLRHKTTLRRVYEAARDQSLADEVLLINEKGEITEFTIGNVVIETADGFRTPPPECGLLPGVYRCRLLKEGVIQESIITKRDLDCARAVYRINSVGGWQRIALLSQVP